MDETDRVNTTQKSTDAAEEATGITIEDNLICWHFEIKKWRNLIDKVMNPS